MNEPLPEESRSDDAHRAARAALAAIPFAGGAAVELFNRLLAPPIQRRRDAWLNGLAARITKLEQDGRVKIEDLQQNNEFVSTVMQASQAAIRNHQREKLDAFRNAVLNTALGQAPEDAKREMFLGLVDEFGVWHLRVLAFLGDPTGWVKQHGQNMEDNRVCHSVESALYNVFPQLYREPDFRKKLVRDLHAHSLIQENDSAFEFSKFHMTPAATTPLGREFLSFITDPGRGDT